MTQFLQTLCQTCGSCLNLITLDPGPEQCDECAAEEEKEIQREREEEEQAKRIKEIEEKERFCRNQQKQSIKAETDSNDSICSIEFTKPHNFFEQNVKKEYTFDDDNDVTLAGVSDIESTNSNYDQEENVSSTVAAISTTTTTTTMGNSSISFAGITKIQTNTSSETRTKSNSPNEWSVEDVINFIAETDPALSVHADLFRKHVRYSINSKTFHSNFCLCLCSAYSRKSMGKHYSYSIRI